jgi:hypothetical protein
MLVFEVRTTMGAGADGGDRLSNQPSVLCHATNRDVE